MNLVVIFIIAATLFHAYMFVRWTVIGWLNVLIKLFLLAMVITGSALTASAFGILTLNL